ncbi:homoserine O-acetyltransferase MetX [Stygiobacter electus]|uniref:Homoserine O-acetyltransferase n=1 Tax=Stygiobacter electus TaxID=3032292 RepID=A0AAE3TBB4_9BACT|nr:homoserine O-acetyltransferase [Stygiobacter electus]MDF1610635.1 homoserine O-acetyltransferase [Stygiobacter electus]
MKDKIKVIHDLFKDENNYQKFLLEDEFIFESGDKLKNITVAYETYGKLNEDGTNAIIVCHALTGDAHASSFNNPDGRDGWWDGIIGEDKALDPKKYFIVCSNFLGSCYGTSGPASINNSTNQKFNLSFPKVTVRDMVHLQKYLIDYLGIQKIKTVIGGSLGGMQALEWALLYPELVESIIPIACGAKHSAWAIGLNEIQRKAIMDDPHWNNGNYYSQPLNGLATARMLAMMTYRTNMNFENRFGRSVKEIIEKKPFYEVESYLHYQGKKLVARFDANAYLYITHAMDSHDIGKDRNGVVNALNSIIAITLVIGIDTDILYPTNEQKEIAENVANGRYHEIKSVYGHDAFLIEFEQMNPAIKNFLESL